MLTLSYLQASEGRAGSKEDRENKGGKKKRGGIMGQRGTSMGEAGEGLLSRRTEGY